MPYCEATVQDSKIKENVGSYSTNIGSFLVTADQCPESTVVTGN